MNIGTRKGVKGRTGGGFSKTLTLNRKLCISLKAPYSGKGGFRGSPPKNLISVYILIKLYTIRL